MKSNMIGNYIIENIKEKHHTLSLPDSMVKEVMARDISQLKPDDRFYHGFYMMFRDDQSKSYVANSIENSLSSYLHRQFSPNSALSVCVTIIHKGLFIFPNYYPNNDSATVYQFKVTGQNDQ